MVQNAGFIYNLAMEGKESPPTNRLESSGKNAGNSAPPNEFLVLIVDDYVDSLAIVCLDLQRIGYRVVTASNGAEAVKIASLTHPDIILMDLAMPHIDGLEATRRIRENPKLKNTPVIAITAYNTGGFRRAAHDAGFDGYLTKPINFDRLHELIQSLIHPR